MFDFQLRPAPPILPAPWAGDCRRPPDGVGRELRARQPRSKAQRARRCRAGRRDPRAGGAGRASRPQRRRRSSVELDESQRAAQADRRRPAGPPGPRGRGAGRAGAARVAAPRPTTPGAGEGRRDDELPHTWAAWRAGRITEWKATLVARETACLSREDRAAVDASVAVRADRLGGFGERELVGRLPAGGLPARCRVVRTRRRRAEADRHVSLRPAPDCMTWLTALLPVKQGVAAYAALTRVPTASARAPATREQGSGDGGRSGRASGLDSAGGARGGQSRASPLNLVDDRHAPFGLGDEPAHLDGYGPIPAELAREIVVGACSRRDACGSAGSTPARTGQTWSRWTPAARLFPVGLARFIRLRDRTCRTPWCDAPIRHTDHAIGHDAGGPTSLTTARVSARPATTPSRRRAGGPDPAGGRPGPASRPPPRPGTPTAPAHRRRDDPATRVRSTTSWSAEQRSRARAQRPVRHLAPSRVATVMVDGDVATRRRSRGPSPSGLTRCTTRRRARPGRTS